MARADWASGRVHAQIIHQLVTELGYDVSQPADNEFGAEEAYLAMANGEVDFWANSHYPSHRVWWQQQKPDGSGLVGDDLVRPEVPIAAASELQGWLVTRSWAESNNVTTLDEINEDPTLWEQFDSDGNGRGEFYGCPPDWTCRLIIGSIIEFAGWDSLEQVSTDYGLMFEEFLVKAQQGEPAIAYVWSPSSFFAQASRSGDVIWISTLDASVLDDSGPLSIDLGGMELWCQRCNGDVGFKDLEPGRCLHGPDGCQLGWAASDIEITANQEWLAAHPKIETLFQQVAFSADDLSEFELALDEQGGDELAVRAVADAWIGENRTFIDQWLAVAEGAG